VHFIVAGEKCVDWNKLDASSFCELGKNCSCLYSVFYAYVDMYCLNAVSTFVRKK